MPKGWRVENCGQCACGGTAGQLRHHCGQLQCRHQCMCEQRPMDTSTGCLKGSAKCYFGSECGKLQRGNKCLRGKVTMELVTFGTLSSRVRESQSQHHHLSCCYQL